MSRLGRAGLFLTIVGACLLGGFAARYSDLDRAPTLSVAGVLAVLLIGGAALIFGDE